MEITIFGVRVLPSLKLDKLLHGMRGEFLLYASSTALVQGSKFATTLFVARVLGPVQTGWWNSLQPLLVYGLMLHLGVVNGMSRDVPYFTGKGEAGRAEYVRRVSWGMSLLAGGLACLLAVVSSRFVTQDPLVSGALLMVGVALIFQQWYTFNTTVLVSAIRFKLLSLQQIAQAALFPVICLPMSHLMGLNGFILAQGIINMLVSILMVWASHNDLRPIFDWKEARRLVGVGFPIMGAGALYDLLRTVDRWVILSFLGPLQVGYYTLSILSLQAVTLLPSVVTAQFYPRMSKRFGETGSYRAVLPLIKNSLLGAAALIVPFGAVIMFLVRPFTLRFMPEYASGITAALIVTLGVTASRPLAGVASTFLNAVGKAHWYFQAQVIALVMQVVLTIGAAYQKMGLTGVAWAVTITQMVNMAMLVGLAYYLIQVRKVPLA